MSTQHDTPTVRERTGRAFAWALVAFYLVVQLAGLKTIGLTDDDDFYVPAGIGYAEWLGRAIRFDRGAFDQRAIDAAFGANREHPPLAKYALGICHFAFRRWLSPTDAARVGTVLFSTLAAALLLAMARRALGPIRGLRAGGFALLALLTLPRFYFHSHAGTLDVPVASMIVLCAALCLRAERRTSAGILSGPAFGLASATKLNSPFFLLAYIPFALLLRLRGAVESARRNRSEGGVLLPPLPLALFSMAILGPLTFLAVWPWMWSDTLQRLGEYVNFHVHHYGIYFLYFGRIYSSAPFAPWHAPFVMAATTIPLATSVLALAGGIAAWPAIRARLGDPAASGEPQRREGELMLFTLLAAAVMIAVVAFAGTPIYGGEKLFMPFFPFWCLLAGYGANWLYEALAARQKFLAAVVCTVACGSGAALQLKFGGYALSEYGGLSNGLRGATATGFERQYYDVAYRDLVAWLSAEAPPNLKVHFLPNNWEYVRTYNWYRQANELRSDIKVTQDEREADWIILTHERRFARYGEDLQRYRQRPVLFEKIVDGTPLWTVLQVTTAEPKSPAAH